jgi:8-oxo-dGTP diphosphatase
VPPLASGPFTPLVGTLVYVWDHDTDRILLIRRNARGDDDHFGKVNGLGGKVDPDESVLQGLRRELFEEAQAAMVTGRFRGTITWTNFGPKREQWLAFVFVVDRHDGEITMTNHEGDLEWTPRTALLAACESPDPTLPMWPGDRHFVPLVFDDDPRPFWGTMPYDGEDVLRWTFERF